MSFADSMRHTVSIARCVAAVADAEGAPAAAAVASPAGVSSGTARYAFTMHRYQNHEVQRRVVLELG